MAIEDKEALDAALKPIQAELHKFLNDIAGTFAFGRYGIALAREHFIRQLEDAESKEGHFLFSGQPQDAEGAFAYYRCPKAKAPERLASDGPVVRELGWQWAVIIFGRWEHDFRPRLAKAAGIEMRQVTEPCWADIRRIRNDIVHHRGIATDRNCGRCEELKWFQPGDEIVITAEHVGEFMKRIGLITLP